MWHFLGISTPIRNTLVDHVSSSGSKLASETTRTGYEWWDGGGMARGLGNLKVLPASGGPRLGFEAGGSDLTAAVRHHQLPEQPKNACFKEEPEKNEKKRKNGSGIVRRTANE